MNIKGHAKIQLFDAKTGELEHEVEEDNMVTNAVSKLLNPPIEFMCGSTSINTIINSITPIATNAMGGVLLFSKKKEEDVDNIATDGENAVGHAGGVYSGTDQYTGTLNVNESKKIENGYRLVWDFASDKANGEIACICLTSRNGGNTGVNQTRDTNKTYYNNAELYPAWGGKYDTMFKSNVASDNINTWNISYGIRGMIDKDTFVSVKAENSAWKLYYHKCFNASKISLTDTNPETTTTTWYKTISVPVENLGNTHSYIDSEGILRGVAHIYSENEDTTYTHSFLCNKIDTRDGTVLLDKKVVIDTATFPSNMQKYFTNYKVYIVGLMKNFIIARFRVDSTTNYQYQTALVDYDGKFIKNIQEGTLWSTGDSNSAFYNHEYKSLVYSSTKGITEDGNLHDIPSFYQGSSAAYTYLYCYKNVFPYFVTSYSSNPTYINLGRCNSYLATINNLSTPVTKTNAQTMKITYDLIES